MYGFMSDAIFVPMRLGINWGLLAFLQDLVIGNKKANSYQKEKKAANYKTDVCVKESTNHLACDNKQTKV